MVEAEGPCVICCSDPAISENVGGLKSEDADRLDSNILIGGCVSYDGVRFIGDCARKNIGRAAALVGDMHQWDFDFFVGAIEIEVEVRELAGAEFAVDANARVDFFTRVTVSFEADFGFEQFDLGGGFGRRGGGWDGGGLGGRGLNRRPGGWILGA